MGKCKRSNTCFIGVPEGEEKECEAEKYLKKCLKMLQIWQKANQQIQEAESTLNRIDPKKSTFKHILIKFLKTKDPSPHTIPLILKAAQ